MCESCPEMINHNVSEGREIVCIGWDGRSAPILRFGDELHLPDHLRAVAPNTYESATTLEP